MKIEGLDKIYIIHYVKLKERRLYLEKRLKELNLGHYALWIVSPENEKFTEKDLYLHDKNKNAIKEREKLLNVKLPSVGKIDIIMMHQHIKILKQIANRKGNKISMVCEDDVLLSEDFPKRLKESIQKLKKITWDICYTDKGSLFIEPEVERSKKDLVALYEPPDKKSNTTGSYLISSNSARKILKLIKKVAICPDGEMNYIQKKYSLKVFWTIPFLTHQGSIEYVYQSNVRKGSITGILLKFTRKIERISPSLARIFLNIADKLRNKVYGSNALYWIKDRIKNLGGYS